jgi:cysteine desulfurase
MATTPIDPAVMVVMQEAMGLDGDFGNPASTTHAYGFAAAERVDRARYQMAEVLACEANELIWTSGATESNNLALQGAAQFHGRRGKHLITMATEHKAVLDVMAYLGTQGFRITYLRPLSNGLIDLAALEAAICDETILVSVMWVNNETGVIQPIDEVGRIVKKRGALFHVDAAQAIGKIPVNLSQSPVDLVSFSAHKVYGPKGVGALYVRQQPRVRLQPLLYGGGHELGLRSGTLAVHQISGMAEAFRLAQMNFADEGARVTRYRDQITQGLENMGGVKFNVPEPSIRVPHCLNIEVAGVDGESLILGLDQIALSSGSACNSANPEPSHVLTAMGLSRLAAQNSVRISLGRYTTDRDINLLLSQFERELTRLRKLSPIWERVNKRLSEPD